MNPGPKVRFLGRVLRHRGLLALVALFTLLYALVSGISLGMILPFADLLFSGASATGPLPAPESGSPLELLRHGIQVRAQAVFFGGEPREALRRICLLLVAAFALKGLLGFFLAAFSVKLEETVLKELRDDLFLHVQTLSMGWFAGRKAGDLLSRATNDVAVVRKAISSMYRTLPRDAALALVYLAVVFLASWRLALLCLVVFPLLAAVIGLIGRRIRRHSSRAQARMADLASIFHETIGGIRVVKAFGAEDYAARRFVARSGDYLKSVVRLRRFASVASPSAELFGAIGAVMVLWAGGNQVLAGTGLSATWFVIFLAAMISLMQPVRALSQIHTHLEEGDAAGARIFEILDARPGVRPPADPIPLPRFEHELRFEDVSFEYDPDVPVLHDISFTVRKGEIVALVGPSGAGKSTLADMVPRFHDPDRGRITLDGVDLKDASLSDLRSLVALVTQETILFHDTVEANIAYADEHPDPDRVVAAAKAANAHEFIERSSEGYRATIGERGLRLSGGERQRLSIARAIYRDPQILILDEATSSLDTESEAKVQEALDRLMEGRTAIVIAHRLSTVQHAHRIVVLEEGRLAETGTHEDLLARGGVYTRLCRSQLLSGFSRAPAG